MTQSERKYFEEKFECIDEKLIVMHRGIYGDEKNGVRGLIDRQAQDENRFKAIEEDQKTVKLTVKIVGGIIGGIITVSTAVNLFLIVTEKL